MSSPKQPRRSEPSGRWIDFQAALFTVDAKLQFVEVTGRPTSGVDDAKRTVGEVDRHGEAVVGVEQIFADLAARCLVEGLQAGKDMVDIGRCAIGGEVEDMDADIAEHAVRTVTGRQAP